MNTESRTGRCPKCRTQLTCMADEWIECGCGWTEIEPPVRSERRRKGVLRVRDIDRMERERGKR